MIVLYFKLSLFILALITFAFLLFAFLFSFLTMQYISEGLKFLLLWRSSTHGCAYFLSILRE